MVYYSSTGVLIMGESGHLPITSSLLANLVLRLILGPLALLASCVPLRLLWKNGEFPACVFVASNWLTVLLVFINAAIWHDQDFDHWWLGYGWCDFQIYIQFALSTVYSASICAMMRRLSIQVSLNRVAGLSGAEKRRQLLVQMLIIFPVPLLQVIFTIFVQGQRYMLAPVNGCNKAYYGNAIYLVFFVLPSPIFTAAACYHTYQTYRKFRLAEASTRLAHNGNNSVAFSRSQRARRKLYLMALSILLPYAPIEAIFCAINIMMGWPWNSPTSFHYVHFAGIVSTWNSIYIISYDHVSFSEMNLNWIPIVTAFVIFTFFGTSKEGINTYRRWLVFFGLGRLFPTLNLEYDPDRTRVETGRFSEGTQTQFSTLNASASPSRKESLVPTYCRVYSAHGSSHGTEDQEGGGDTTVVPAPSSWRSDLRSRLQKARMWPTRTSSPNTADELELERNAAPFAATWQPAASVIFRPGLNWSAPPRVPALAMSSFRKASSAQTTPDTRTKPNPPLRPCQAHPSPQSAVPVIDDPDQLTDELTIEPLRENRAIPKPFDGTVIQGATAEQQCQLQQLAQVGQLLHPGRGLFEWIGASSPICPLEDEMTVWSQV
ncbi:a-pheromone receptor [Grosmannia clavigera kw1407]|uniref:A-pheromone receptor n=1 Tax=Grosmannia clavigera (strain kw1407 / UAMH 11150) TaxID=655863 RepID=F0XPU5_GROCL|nr:a-pheromone receptor [Grosmannia clavigera kw1407]EFX00552.1 a-pheromone receptor [Grosmannia clavigera kw1407]